MSQGQARRCSPLFELLLLLLFFAGGCATQAPAPIDGTVGGAGSSRPAPPPAAAPPVATATVRKGDTLYAIAFARGLDFHDIARWNAIDEPYTIYPGQVLRLGPPTAGAAMGTPAAAVEPVSAARATSVTVVERVPAPVNSSRGAEGPVFVPLSDEPKKATEPKQLPPAVAVAPAVTPVAGPNVQANDLALVNPTPAPSAGTKSSAERSEPRPQQASAAAQGGWQWPTEGKVVEAFGASGRKGVVVGGSAGQTIRAARSGEVVYAGGGLLGYGLLVIVKHDNTYLSAYGNNSRLLVKEGTRVEAGQGIAEMGASADGRVGLHFELRRKGQPIDPLTLVKAP